MSTSNIPSTRFMQAFYAQDRDFNLFTIIPTVFGRHVVWFNDTSGPASGVIPTREDLVPGRPWEIVRGQLWLEYSKQGVKFCDLNGCVLLRPQEDIVAHVRSWFCDFGASEEPLERLIPGNDFTGRNMHWYWFRGALLPDQAERLEEGPVIAIHPEGHDVVTGIELRYDLRGVYIASLPGNETVVIRGSRYRDLYAKMPQFQETKRES